ncbi:MAG: transglycosylase domain-containing protein [Flavobacteriales bacterium]
MKTIIKLSKILFGIGLGLATILILFITFLTSRFHQPFNENELKELIKNIEQEPIVDKRFFQYYSKFYRIDNTTNYLINLVSQKRSPTCPCLHISNLMVRGLDSGSIWNRITKNKFVYNYKLEYSLSQEQCFNYWISHYNFLYNNRGVKEASKFYFQKPVEKLNEDEIITLLIQLRNPSLYNPRKHPDRLRKRIEVYKRVINNYSEMGD